MNFSIPTLPPALRKALRIASSIVKDDRIPEKKDGFFQVLMKGLSIFDLIQNEFGESYGDFGRLREEGLVPIDSEAFVRLFFNSRLKDIFQIQRRSIGQHFLVHDARSASTDQRLVFLQRENHFSGFPYESTVFTPADFRFDSLRAQLQQMYPNGLLLSTMKEDWRTRLTFLDMEPPDVRFITTVAKKRVESLIHKMTGKAPRGSFLFFGPIGTGKTLATFMLSKATNRWPLWVDASAMEEIGLEEVGFLLQVFQPGILAVDDFDRIPNGKANARLLLVLERIRKISPTTLTILSANEAEKIDFAALRGKRIDEVVDFNLPTEEERNEIAQAIPLPEGVNIHRLLDQLGTSKFNHSNLAMLMERIADGEPVADALRVMGRLAELSEAAKAANNPPDSKPKA